MPDYLPMYRWCHPVHEIQDRIGTSSPRAWCFGSHDFTIIIILNRWTHLFFCRAASVNLLALYVMSLIDTAEGEKNHLNFTFPLSSNWILHIFDHIRTVSLQRKSGLSESIMFHHVVDLTSSYDCCITHIFWNTQQVSTYSSRMIADYRARTKQQVTKVE